MTLPKVKSPEILTGDVSVLDQLPCFGQHLALVGHIPVANIRTKKRVQAEAQGQKVRTERQRVEGVVRFTAENHNGYRRPNQFIESGSTATGVRPSVRRQWFLLPMALSAPTPSLDPSARTPLTATLAESSARPALHAGCRSFRSRRRTTRHPARSFRERGSRS